MQRQTSSQKRRAKSEAGLIRSSNMMKAGTEGINYCYWGRESKYVQMCRCQCQQKAHKAWTAYLLLLVSSEQRSMVADVVDPTQPDQTRLLYK